MEPDNLKKILLAMELKNMERFDDLHASLSNISQVRGRKGEDGYTPVKGVDYFDGKDGKDGIDGKDGRDGKDGVNGKDGRDGIDGINGKDGKDGKDGQDGSEDTPEVIADKLNSLEQVLDWSVLKNFDSLVNQDTLTRAIQTLENQTRYLIQRVANSSSGSGVTTIGTIDSQVASADGAVIAGTSLYMQSASATVPGLINTGEQTITGLKTLSTTRTTTGVSIQNFLSLLEIDFSSVDSADSHVANMGYVSIIDGQNHTNGSYIGSYGAVAHQGAGTVSIASGSLGYIFNNSTGTITTAISFESGMDNSGGGTIVTGYGYKVGTLAGTTKYGFYNDIAGSLNVLTQTHILTGLPIRFYDTDGSHYTGLKANGTTTASIEYTLPAAGPAANGYALVSTTAGVMSWASLSSATIPINNLLAATGTNTINNADYAQVWQWNSLTTQTGLTLSTSSITTGALLQLTSTSTAITTSGKGLGITISGIPGTNSGVFGADISVTSTGGSSTTYGIRTAATVASNSANGYGIYSTVSGNFGITGTITAAGYFLNSVQRNNQSPSAWGIYAEMSNSSNTGTSAAGRFASSGPYGIYVTAPGASTAGYFSAGNPVGGSGTAYGVYSVVTSGAGGSQTNVAGYFSSSGSPISANYAIIVPSTGGNIGFGTTTPTAYTHIVQPVSTTGSPNALLLVGGAHTTLTASTEAIDINFNLARTVQFATGALTTQRAFLIQNPTYGFVGASTITTAATVSISGSPVAGTNATITTSVALDIPTSAVGSGVTTSYALQTAPSTGATNNYNLNITGNGRSFFNTTATQGLVNFGTLSTSTPAINIRAATSMAGEVFNVENSAGSDQFQIYTSGTVFTGLTFGSTVNTPSITQIARIRSDTNAVANVSFANNTANTLAAASFTLSTSAASDAKWQLNSATNATYGGNSSANLINVNNAPLTLATNDTVRVTVTGSGLVGVGTASPTAYLHLAAGTTAANTAPLKFTSGSLNTTAEAGAIEFLTDAYYATVTTNAIRKMLVASTDGRATGQTAANASVATYTLGAADQSFEVSANVLVTTSSAEAFTVTVDYTDEGNTARTVTLNFQLVGGTIGTNIAFANGAVPYEGIPLHIRCKASTTITIKTAAGGTYTGCTYNVEGIIKRVA